MAAQLVYVLPETVPNLLMRPLSLSHCSRYSGTCPARWLPAGRHAPSDVIRMDWQPSEAEVTPRSERALPPVLGGGRRGAARPGPARSPRTSSCRGHTPPCVLHCMPSGLARCLACDANLFPQPLSPQNDTRRHGVKRTQVQSTGDAPRGSGRLAVALDLGARQCQWSGLRDNPQARGCSGSEAELPGGQAMARREWASPGVAGPVQTRPRARSGGR